MSKQKPNKPTFSSVREFEMKLGQMLLLAILNGDVSFADQIAWAIKHPKESLRVGEDGSIDGIVFKAPIPRKQSRGLIHGRN